MLTQCKVICCPCALSCTAASITLHSAVEKVTLQIHANLPAQFNTLNSLSCEEQQLHLVLRLQLSQWHPMQLGARCAHGAVLGGTRASVVFPSHKLGLYTWCECCALLCVTVLFWSLQFLALLGAHCFFGAQTCLAFFLTSQLPMHACRGAICCTHPPSSVQSSSACCKSCRQ